jgi:hypothetical protein
MSRIGTRNPATTFAGLYNVIILMNSKTILTFLDITHLERQVGDLRTKVENSIIKQ